MTGRLSYQIVMFFVLIQLLQNLMFIFLQILSTEFDKRNIMCVIASWFQLESIWILKLIKQHCSPDVVGLDQWTSMKECRQIFGDEWVLQGNIDPAILFGTELQIEDAVKECMYGAGFKKHILNVGHGVIQGTPEENVKLFVKMAKDEVVIENIV
eukprot:TRINITY_DN8744_c0_g2_i11.p2 TRINITY_DN8744_c0_g2~~TRINITY_DN8744_c0_g2_i11.p2  ORF type:complete len:177 (-),score=18.93 TRINITY_DN8744_c0_g2_i11:72-536(-)